MHQTPARPTQSIEPILIPKLRISFADFPYLHYSKRPEAVHLGDLLRIWVRARTKITLPHSDFHGPTRALWTLQEPQCFTVFSSLSPGKPLPGNQNLTKKRQLSPGLPPTSLSSFALPHWVPKDLSPSLGLGILTQFPFGIYLSSRPTIVQSTHYLGLWYGLLRMP